MPISVQESGDNQLLEARASGRIEADDYQGFMQAFERRIRHDSKLALVLEFHDFEGLSKEGAWAEIPLVYEHLNNVVKVALVGDREWEAAMTRFGRPFAKATLQFYKPDEIDAAREWARSL